MKQTPLKRYLLRHRSKLSAELSKVLKTSSKRGVHDLRVEIRRVQSVLSILRQRPEIIAIDRRLRKLNRKLGKVRELDVAIRDSNLYGVEASRMKVKRRKQRKLLTKYLLRKRVNLLESLKSLDDVHPQHLISKSQLNAIPKRLFFKKTSVTPKTDIHRVRITLKRARYLLEGFGENTKPLERLQVELGRIHDLEILKHLTGGNSKTKKDLDELSKRVHRIGPAVLRRSIAQLKRIRS